MARGKNPKANAKANNKAALKPVTLSLPGQGLRTVMAGEAVQMMKQQRQAGQIPLAAAIAQQISQQVPALDEPWRDPGHEDDLTHYGHIFEDRRKPASR